MDLLINRKARDRAGLLSVVNGAFMASTAKLPRLVRNDGEPVTVRVFNPSDSGDKDFVEVDLSNVSVRIGIGLPDQAPTAGTFFLQVGSDVTADLPFNASAAVVEAALNLLPGIIAQGGVTVTKPADGAYQVIWNVAGTQGSIPATLLRSATPRIYQLPAVTGYTGGGATNLDGITTRTSAINSLFVVVVNGVMSVWRLEAGTAATDTDAGIIRPADYDATTNAVNLIRVEGL
ncbi:MAG: hypothetical protein QOI07_914 [Verrucomicrobiota bacterium]|jgi:hypothetical protein